MRMYISTAYSVWLSCAMNIQLHCVTVWFLTVLVCTEQSCCQAWSGEWQWWPGVWSGIHGRLPQILQQHLAIQYIRCECIRMIYSFIHIATYVRTYVCSTYRIHFNFRGVKLSRIADFSNFRVFYFRECRVLVFDLSFPLNPCRILMHQLLQRRFLVMKLP